MEGLWHHIKQFCWEYRMNKCLIKKSSLNSDIYVFIVLVYSFSCEVFLPIIELLNLLKPHPFWGSSKIFVDREEGTQL